MTLARGFSLEEAIPLARCPVLAVVVLGALLIGSPALAQSSPQGGKASPLVGKLKASLVKVDPTSGKEVLVKADQVQPKDVVQYTLSYRNAGKLPLTGVAMIVPIPEGTTYLDRSAMPIRGTALEFSVDGGLTYQKPPLKVRERGPGGDRLVAAGPDQVTHVRWLVAELTPGGNFSGSCRVAVK